MQEFRLPYTGQEMVDRLDSIPKMQDRIEPMAEEFTADREQIATNKEDIGLLKEALAD